MPPNHSDTTEIFIAYAPQDTAIREELEKHLSNLDIKIHHDGKIEAGKVTDKAIHTYLQKADIVLLLLSADFLADDKIYDEQLTQIIDRHEKEEVRVIPIIARSCLWEVSPFAKLQALPHNEMGKIVPVAERYRGKIYPKEELLTQIAKSIQGIVKNIDKNSLQQESPQAIVEEENKPLLTSNKPLTSIEEKKTQKEEVENAHLHSNVSIPSLNEIESLQNQEQEQEDRKNKLRGLFYLRCDRKQQSEEFTDCIEQRITPDFNKPFFYLIHGPFEEQHYNLVKRFWKFKIDDLAAQVISQTKGVVDFYTIKEFPVSKDLDFRKRQLKRKIAEEIDTLNGANWTSQKLLDLYQTRTAGGVIVLQHNISCDTWDAQTLPLLQWYIRDFWKVQIEQENLYVIIFLNIIYPEAKKSFLKRLFGSDKSEKVQLQLTKLADELQNQCNLLAALEPVTMEDVRIWMSDFDLHEMKNLANKLFTNKDKVSMELIEKTFKNPIEDLRRDNGQAAIRGL